MFPDLNKKPKMGYELVKEVADEHSKKYNNGCKVIFNPPYTILLTPDGKKFISKAHEEEFDEEKGLLMCLAKDNGVSHLELKKMLNSATRTGIKKNKE